MDCGLAEFSFLINWLSLWANLSSGWHLDLCTCSFNFKIGRGRYTDNAARANTPDAVKESLQQDYAECILQIALYPAGAEVLMASDLPVPPRFRIQNSGGCRATMA